MKSYGLIGFPLKQSFSQKYFTEKFSSLNIDAEYLNFSIPSVVEITDIINNTPTLQGFNVTIPYKKDIIPFLDELDETAEQVGAVNVVKIKRDNGIIKLKGFNSDVIGFENSLKKYLTPKHKKALILGTGGASLAVEFSLKRLGIEYLFVSREPKNSKTISYQQIDKELLASHTLIINSSPLGMFPNIETAPEIPYNHLTANHLLYDLVYNPPITKFMELGLTNGAKAVNGLEMLHGQAEEAWSIWNNDSNFR